MCKECWVTLSRVIDGVNVYRLKCRFQAMADPSTSILHLVIIRLKAKTFFLPYTFSLQTLVCRHKEKLKFVSTPGTFKPGMKFIAYLKVTQQDGTPLLDPKQTVNITCKIQ